MRRRKDETRDFLPNEEQANRDEHCHFPRIQERGKTSSDILAIPV